MGKSMWRKRPFKVFYVFFYLKSYDSASEKDFQGKGMVDSYLPFAGKYDETRQKQTM